MGRMFQGLFEADGLRGLIAGRRTELTDEALVAQSDVVIVTVPIRSTVETIRRIAPVFGPVQLFSDFTSIKQDPVAEMMASKASVIGCHPIFGPMPDPAGQNVVLCPERPGPFLNWYRNWFEAHGMNVRLMSPAAHDDAMAVIQGLTHVINIAFAGTMQSRQVPLEELLAICSPVYRVFFSVMCRILSGDPALYGEIQVVNRGSRAVVESFLENGKELLELVGREDMEGFQQRFKEAAAYLGEYRQVAREESDFLVEQLKRYADAKLGAPPKSAKK